LVTIVPQLAFLQGLKPTRLISGFPAVETAGYNYGEIEIRGKNLKRRVDRHFEAAQLLAIQIVETFG
jgi:hypothetical protein